MAIPELNEVTSIEIFAEWFGLGTPCSSDYEIVARGGAFFGGDASIDPIDPRDIEALLVSLNAPPVHSPDPANMGFSPEWLELNLEPAIEDNLGGYSRQGKRRLLELLRSFEDFSELVKSQFAYLSTDDSPFVRVRIYSHTCAPVEVRSSSQYSFMIPWEVATLEGDATTHNARIGRAVAGLLPKGFLEKSRLNGDELIPRIFDRLSGDDALLDLPATVLRGHHRAISTLLVTRLMPCDAIARTSDFTFSHDARHVAALQNPNSLHLQRLMVWEVVSGRNLLQVHTTSCNCVIMLPDGKMIVTGHWDGSIMVWPVGT